MSKNEAKTNPERTHNKAGTQGAQTGSSPDGARLHPHDLVMALALEIVETAC